MNHRKGEHPSNIVCKYFLTNTCRRSRNQGALFWLRYDQLTLPAPHVANAGPNVATSVCPFVEHKFSLIFRHEPEPYVRTTATNGNHDATAETSTGATATTASGADENDDDPDVEHKCVHTENDNNVEYKKSHSYDIDSKNLFNSTNATSKLLPNKRFKKKQQQI